MIIIFILIGVAFLSGWITLIRLAVRNEIRFEDKQIEEIRGLRKKDNDKRRS